VYVIAIVVVVSVIAVVGVAAAIYYFAFRRRPQYKDGIWTDYTRMDPSGSPYGHL